MILLNVITFQIGWFACVLSAAKQQVWLGLLISAALLVFHIFSAKQKHGEARLVIIAMLFGLVFDTIPLSLCWLAFSPVPYWPDAISPPWMIALWGLFATTMNYSLRWLKKLPIVAIILGGVSGPASYYFGEKLGALTVQQFDAAMIYLAIGWAIALPLLLKLASTKTLFSDSH
jgi:hypothetical protein